jgi:hypothetical protein
MESELNCLNEIDTVRAIRVPDRLLGRFRPRNI